MLSHRQWSPSVVERDDYWFVFHSIRTGSSQTAPNVTPHLIDEHDGENGHVDEFGFAAGEKEGETWRGQRGHLAQHVAQIGTQCEKQRSE